MALLPKIHPLGEAEADIFGAANPWSRLQDGGNEDEGAFRIPPTFTDAPKFPSEYGEEASAYFAGRYNVTAGVQLDYT
jgi:hypothetical protein